MSIKILFSIFLSVQLAMSNGHQLVSARFLRKSSSEASEPSDNQEASNTPSTIFATAESEPQAQPASEPISSQSANSESGRNGGVNGNADAHTGGSTTKTPYYSSAEEREILLRRVRDDERRSRAAQTEARAEREKLREQQFAANVVANPEFLKELLTGSLSTTSENPTLRGQGFVETSLQAGFEDQLRQEGATEEQKAELRRLAQNPKELLNAMIQGFSLQAQRAQEENAGRQQENGSEDEEDGSDENAERRRFARGLWERV